MSIAANHAGALNDAKLDCVDAGQRAAHDLAVGQVYPLGDSLLREPLATQANEIRRRVPGYDQAARLSG